jgi:hypothetical protein
MSMPTAQNETDFMTMLDEELKSSCTSKIHDTHDVPIEDVIRDIHKVLNGNGGPTKGLVFKMAVNSVHIRQIRSEVEAVSNKLVAQVARCDEVQRAKREDSRVAAAEYKTIGRIGQALWDNKALILVLLIAVVSYMGNRSVLNQANGSVDPVVLEKVIDKILDVKLGSAVLDDTL